MITCLISSPRKNGFGASIAAKAVEGAESVGKTVSVHHLNDMTSYRQCQNCGGCKNNGCHCVLKDDITPILEEIRDAEGLILCTSINFNDTNGLFKLVFDRLYSFLDMNSCSAMPKGKKVAENVRCIVIPATQDIVLQASGGYRTAPGSCRWTCPWTPRSWTARSRSVRGSETVKTRAAMPDACR